MAVEAAVDGKPVLNKPEYPYLGISPNGVIVLFTEPGTGVTVGEGGIWQVGKYSKVWSEGVFNPFTGTVTLRNKA